MFWQTSRWEISLEKTLTFDFIRGGDTYIGVISSEGGEITQQAFDKGQSWANSFSLDGAKLSSPDSAAAFGISIKSPLDTKPQIRYEIQESKII